MTTGLLSASTPVQYLKGVGPFIKELLEKKSIFTVLDLLYFLPIKYVDLRQLHSIRSLPAGKKQSFLAQVESYDEVAGFGRGKKRLEMIVSDATGVARVTFFHRFSLDSLKKRFPEGSQVLFFGDVKIYRGMKALVHPEMEIWDDEDEVVDFENVQKSNQAIRIYPFYSLTEGLHQKTIRNIFAKNLESLLTLICDEPRSVRESGEVGVSLVEAFRYVHQPPLSANMDLLNARHSPYHQRIIYDEFFYLQLGLLMKKSKQAKRKSFMISSNQLLLFKKGLSLLPFELTYDQKMVLQEVLNNYSADQPMNRLLQGDVGCGKTIVAFLSILPLMDSGFQVAMMAPTEILAEQHFKNLQFYAERLSLNIALLTSTVTGKVREQILDELKNGRIQLLIGTHALLTPDVLFNNLAYIIIDEQHRFGVLQRAQLKTKSNDQHEERVPHVLVMTATPIPRTLSMCLYGDLDLSIIHEMPRGRWPVQTKVFREKQRQKMYDFIRQELKKGRQAYFVYPLIEESEKVDLKNATLMHKDLCKIFSEYTVSLLHGKMKSTEKDAVMAAYKSGEINILVSTTVIEVGVDVPNATIMVVEHAERFGLSQLHQLRGRVGRSAEKSFCFLVASYAQSLESQFRLKIMEETNDGFKIAEEDLKIRGPGEFLGTRQSGLPDFHLAELTRDAHLLAAAKKRAEEILAEDPELDLSKNAVMKKIMSERWQKKLEISMV